MYLFDEKKPAHHVYENQLKTLIRSSQHMMTVLQTVRESELPDWYVGAGTIRNLVWDHQHGYEEPTAARDVDVAFFDSSDLSNERDAKANRQLLVIQPDIPWEATNQAAVHLWYEKHFGRKVEPYASCEEAIATWPETATSVGVRLLPDDQLKIFAPYGLEDLFEMRLRRNPARVSVERFRKRARDKRILETWPKVTLIDG